MINLNRLLAFRLHFSCSLSCSHSTLTGDSMEAKKKKKFFLTAALSFNGNALCLCMFQPSPVNGYQDRSTAKHLGHGKTEGSSEVSWFFITAWRRQDNIPQQILKMEGFKMKKGTLQFIVCLLGRPGIFNCSIWRHLKLNAVKCLHPTPLREEEGESTCMHVWVCVPLKPDKSSCSLLF